jgi:hypothetical protein
MQMHSKFTHIFIIYLTVGIIKSFFELLSNDKRINFWLIQFDSTFYNWVQYK